MTSFPPPCLRIAIDSPLIHSQLVAVARRAMLSDCGGPRLDVWRCTQHHLSSPEHGKAARAAVFPLFPLHWEKVEPREILLAVNYNLYCEARRPRPCSNWFFDWLIALLVSLWTPGYTLWLFSPT